MLYVVAFSYQSTAANDIQLLSFEHQIVIEFLVDG